MVSRSLTWLVLVSAMIFESLSPSGAQTGVTNMILGEAEVANLPAAPVNVRVSEAEFTPITPALTHAHALGWVYVTQGAHVLVMRGRNDKFQPGAAAWTPAGVEHTHDWDRTQVHKFWFIGTGTNQPTAVPPGFRLFHLTETLRGLQSGPYVVRLARLTLQPGAAAQATKVTQPEVLIGVSGTTSILMTSGSQTLKREQVLLVQPGSAYLARNLSPESTALLVQSLIPKD